MSDHSELNHALSRMDGAGTGPPRPPGPLVLPDHDDAELRSVSDSPASHRPVSPRLLLRFKGTIIAVFLVVAGPAVGAIWGLLAAEYQAEALLEVRSVLPVFVYPTADRVIPQYQQYLRTQVDIMTSTTVLERVLEREEIRQTSWFHESGDVLDRLRGRRLDPLEHLLSVVTAASRPGTDLISIAVSTRHPRDAAVIANGLLDEYLKFSSERLSEEDRQIYRQLDEEKTRLEIQINLSEREIKDDRKELGTPVPDDVIAQRRVRLDQLEAEIEQLAEQIEIRQQLLRDLESPASQPGGPASAPSAVRYADDAQWRQLQGELKTAQKAAANAAIQFQEAHPTRQRLEKDVALARAALEERQAELDKLAESGVPLPTTMPGQVGVLLTRGALQSEIRQFELSKQLREKRAKDWRESFDLKFTTAEQLRKHLEELDRDKSRLQAVQQRLNELEDKKRVPATIQTIARATTPTQPHSDKRLKLTVAALFGALAAGLACAYLRSAFSPQVQEVGDVNRSVGSAFLGYLPLQRASEAPTLEDSPLQAECVRMIRTALLNRLSGGGQVVQLASAGPGSGKSTLAALLARSLAQAGRHVLLIDADIHRPSQANYFALKLSPGLLDLLAGSSADGAICATDLSSLSILPAGKSGCRQDLELLSNGVFSALLERWRSQYSYILLDGPPLLESADAAILSRHADGTILVVRERHCRQAALLEALAVLTGAGGRLLGTVFVGSGRGGSYGYGYGQGYGYQYTPAEDRVLLQDPQKPAG